MQRRTHTHSSCALCPSAKAGGESRNADGDRRQPNREERGKKGPKIDSAGYDAGKKIKGKKRRTAVDTIGLLINLGVSAGDVQDPT
jgi:hypothetical protein